MKALTIVDAFSKICLALEVGFNCKASQVTHVLDHAVAIYGVPKYLRIDNGPEFISKQLDLWAYQHNVVLDFSRPGKPTDNSYIESFNSRFRQECLNQQWFLNLVDAKAKIEAWRREYISHRPHSSLGYKTSEEFRACCTKGS